MAIERLGRRDLARMRAAGRVAAATLVHVVERLRPGVTTAEIDRWVRADTERRGARPSQLGYHGFPATVCTSVNEVVCHGIPSESVQLREGDIINVDVTSELDGFHGDTSVTVAIGEVSADARRVVDVARRGLATGIEAAIPGNRLGDVGAAIEAVARAEGCGIVRQFCGHGIGRRMHMPPQVAHVGPAGRGLRLRSGMTFTIEPMVTIGWPEIEVLEDGWTAVTVDGTPSAQFEHTIAITEHGAEILTVPPAVSSAA